MSSLLRVTVLLWLVVATAFAARPFAQESSDLPADPAARFGTLPNGVRYVIRANAEPKGRAALRFVVLAGSFMETERERGIAHYLEHMSFNGSTHYAPGTLVEFFQRLGMNFGGDTNAYTSFDRTVYMIDLPDTKAETLAEGFRVFSDYAGGLLLEQKSVEKERPIILAEMRTRDTVQYRMMMATLGFALPDTLLSQRMPIGAKEVIEQVQREDFVHFYDTWYRPERIAVVAVGDFDPAQVEKQLAEAMAPVADRAPALPDPNPGSLARFEGVRAFAHFEREAPATTVSIMALSPYAKEADTRANRLKYLPRGLALAMVNRRLAILAKQEGAPFLGGQTSVQEVLDFYREATIELMCKPDQWQAALGVAEHELRRALEHGFQKAELAEAVANMREGLENAVKTASTRRSPDLAMAISDSVADDNVFTSPETDLALYAPQLAEVTPETCTEALRSAWAVPQRHVLVVGNAQIEGDAPTVVAQAYERAHAEAVAAPEKIADAAFAYTDFGPAGTVAESRRVEDLDATLVTFANGVRFNFKKTDFEANQVHVSVRIGNGQLAEPKDQTGLSVFATSTFVAGGLGRHSADDLQRLLAGRTLGLNFAVNDDALVLSGTTNREDLLLQLQLIAAHITDPGYRPEALRQIRKAIEPYYNQLAHVPQGPLMLEVPRLLASGDARFGLPPREVLLSRTQEESKAWLAPQLASGAVEVAIVGDIDIDATVAAVARTLGALPKRGERPAFAAERVVKFPDEPFSKDFQVDTQIPKAVVAIYWPTTDGNDIKLARRLRLLTDVLSDRLRVKVREEMGEAYGWHAGCEAGETYPGYGYIFASTVVSPEKTEAVQQAILAAAEDLQKNGVTDDELTRAKLPVLTALRESARTNGYWLGRVLDRAQEKPEILDWCRTRYSDNEAITKAELDALAKQYFVPARVCRVVSRPAAAPASSAPVPAK